MHSTLPTRSVPICLAVIMFITRLAVRIEEAATLVLSPDQVPSHDRRFLAPQDPHSLLSRLIELRVLLRDTVTPVLQAWLAGLAKEQGGDTAKQLSLTCNVHAHLLFLHSNLQPYQLSKEAVSLVLASFMQVELHSVRTTMLHHRAFSRWLPTDARFPLQIMHGYSGATILHVPLSTLFQIIHKLRGSLVGWLESDSRRSGRVGQVIGVVAGAGNSRPAAAATGR